MNDSFYDAKIIFERGYFFFTFNLTQRQTQIDKISIKHVKYNYNCRKKKHENEVVKMKEENT